MSEQEVPALEAPTGIENEVKYRHFFVLVHGIRMREIVQHKMFSKVTLRPESEFAVLKKQILEKYKQDALVLISKENEAQKTSDGIETLGLRLAAEILQFFEENITKTESGNTATASIKYKFSIVGHSLGGLISRYAVYLLFGDQVPEASKLNKQQLARFHTLCEPTDYISMTSPHLGSRKATSGSLHLSIVKGVTSFFCNNMLGKTGQELHLDDTISSDKKTPQVPLLVRMSQGEFLKSLLKFAHRTLVSTTHDDVTVPYCSSSIRANNPYTRITSFEKPRFFLAGYSGFEDALYTPHQQYFHQKLQEVHQAVSKKSPRSSATITMSTASSTSSSETAASTPSIEQLAIPNQAHLNYDLDLDSEIKLAKAVATSNYFIDDKCEVEFPADLYRNLNSIPWRRIDVEFQLDPAHKFQVHCMPVHKQTPWLKGKSVNDVLKVSEHFSSFLLDVLDYDHSTPQPSASSSPVDATASTTEIIIQA